MAFTSGFLVPRTLVTASPSGWVHQSVAPTSNSGRVAAIASVSDGTSDTTRRTCAGRSTGSSRSSRMVTR